jgi:Uma2 family endonuclease
METTAVRSLPKTYADYQKLKEGEPCQLIDGMFVMSPSPSVSHQRIVKRIGWKLSQIEAQGNGELLHAPMDVYFSDTEVYQPDLLFISKERLSIIGEKEIEGAPDLIVEVLSPTNAYYDLRHKMRIYEATGVREYWIVDPMETSMEFYSNIGGIFTLSARVEKTGVIMSLLFPAFAIDAAELFAYR